MHSPDHSPRATLGALLCMVLAIGLFYWKITLTHQYSLLTDWEGVSQAYSWNHFWVDSVRNGRLPLWDPFSWLGKSYIGEMQTAVFYPLNALLLLAPLNRQGVFSPQYYHQLFVIAHMLGGFFMFALLREFRFRRFPAIFGALCFTLGGFVSRMPWPHMLNSAIWLPLIFLLLMRAIAAEDSVRRIAYAVLTGFFLGIATLAGGLHVAIMQGVVVATAALLFFTGRNRLVIALIAFVAFATAAVQLLPSMEYSRDALRWLGAFVLPASEKIPYAEMSHGLYPHSVIALLVPYAFHGGMGTGEVVNPYMGVLPLLLAVVGVWKNWQDVRVRYLTGLGVAAYLYAWGGSSLLHGVVYATVPWMWIAREAGRWVYLTSFAIAILAAFGLRTILSGGLTMMDVRRLNRVLAIAAAVAAAVLLAGGLFPNAALHSNVSLSLVLIAGTAALAYWSSCRLDRRSVQLLWIAAVLFDLSCFDWVLSNKLEVTRTRPDEYERLLSAKPAAAFLRSQPGPFRVSVDVNAPPNIGHLFGVQTTRGSGVTLPKTYHALSARPDVMNVQYTLRPASSDAPDPVYSDAHWKVYRNMDAFPRAWLVHRAEAASSPQTQSADLRSVALLEDASIVPHLAASDGQADRVAFTWYSPNAFELRVETAAPSMVVLSEPYAPGWRATANDRETAVLRVNGGLRGVLVPAGSTTLRLRYWPDSVRNGLILGVISTVMSVAAALVPLAHARGSEH